MTRLEQLQQFFKDDPTDPFNIYALALEYSSTAPMEAQRLFDELLTHHSDYLPVYYTAGKFLASNNGMSRAMEVFELGIEKARQQGQTKTVRELQSALDELRFELE